MVLVVWCWFYLLGRVWSSRFSGSGLGFGWFVVILVFWRLSRDFGWFVVVFSVWRSN